MWSLFAAVGLSWFTPPYRHARHQEHHPGHERFLVGYVVLAVSFVLGNLLLQSVGNRPEADLQRDLMSTWATPIPRAAAVFAEDSAALTGFLIAAAGPAPIS